MRGMRGTDARGAEWRAALAVMAAVAGAGYASGRELVIFFAQTGWAAWPGIAFACLAFALLVGAIGRCAQRGGAANVWRQMGRRAGGAASAMHALLMAFTAAVMLQSAGEVGALALPVRGGYLWGAGLALLVAGLANVSGQRLLPWLGLTAALLGVGLYAGLAIDPRPVRVYLRGETVPALRGNLPAALLLALLYAAMNAAIAGDVAARFSTGTLRPPRLAMLCGAMLGALLLCGNAAIARGGDVLLAQALPTVILAARWGLAGFWLSALLAFLCAATTLAAALGALLSKARAGGRWRGALLLGLTAALLAAFGLSDALGKGYAALGWACAFAVAAFADGFDARRVRHGWDLDNKKGALPSSEDIP